MSIDTRQLAVENDASGNPIFEEYRLAVIAHDDLGGWLLAIDDGRYVICETDDAVNIYGRDRDDLMARHDRNEWADGPHGEGAPVSRVAQLEADKAALMEALKPFADLADGISPGRMFTTVHNSLIHDAAKALKEAAREEAR